MTKEQRERLAEIRARNNCHGIDVAEAANLFWLERREKANAERN